MKRIGNIAACIACLTLVACSAEPPPKENIPSAVPQAQLDALEKAKAVEKSMQDEAKKREKEMRERGT